MSAVKKCVVVLVACALYINSLQGGLLFDDEGAVNENKDVTDHSSPLNNLLKNDFWGSSMEDPRSHKSWRPLTVLTYRINHLYHGVDPMGYHLVNVLLHGLASGLFVEVCDCIFMSNGPSIAAGLLFAAHPIHTEAVAGVVGRAEELCAIFMMLSFLIFVGSCHTKSKFTMLVLAVLAQFFVLVALLCKETGIAVLGVNTAYDCYIAFYKMYPAMKAKAEDKDSSKDGKKEKVSEKDKKAAEQLVEYGSLVLRIILTTICGVVFLYFRLRLSKPPKFPYNANPMAFADSLQTRVLSRCYIWFLNMWLLLVPHWLCADWSSGSVALVEEFSDPRNLCSAAMFALALALLLYLLPGSISPFRSSTTNSPRTKFVPYMGLAILAITFLPASGLLLDVGMVVGERVLYSPSMGFIVLLVWVGKTCLPTMLAKPLFWLTFLLYSAKTVHRNGEWFSQRTLFGSAVKVNPSNSKLWLFLSTTHEGNKAHGEEPLDPKDHEAYLRKSIALESLLPKSRWADPWFDLGSFLDKANRYDEAFAVYTKGLQREDADVRGNLAFGRLLRKMGKKAEAKRRLEFVISKEPDDAVALSNLAQVIGGDDLKKVTELLDRAIKARPADAEFPGNAGAILAMNGKETEAIPYFELAVAAEKSEDDARYMGMLWQACLGAGQLDKAEKHLKANLAKTLNDPDPMVGMGMVLAHKGDVDTAEIWFKKAIKLAPNEPPVQGSYQWFMQNKNSLKQQAHGGNRGGGGGGGGGGAAQSKKAQPKPDPAVPKAGDPKKQKQKRKKKKVQI